MIVDTPAAVAISAAMSFVSILPVPKFEPRVAVLTTAISWTKSEDGLGD